MGVLFLLIITRRIIFDEKADLKKLAFHLTVIALFMIALKLHAISKVATRLVPLFIGCLSYYGHTQFLMLSINMRAGQLTIEPRSPAQAASNSEEQHTMIQMDINEILRHIIIFGAFFINHIYIDIFLTIKNIDSLILNIATWGLFCLNSFFHPGKSLKHKKKHLKQGRIIKGFQARHDNS